MNEKYIVLFMHQLTRGHMHLSDRLVQYRSGVHVHGHAVLYFAGKFKKNCSGEL